MIQQKSESIIRLAIVLTSSGLLLGTAGCALFRGNPVPPPPPRPSVASSQLDAAADAELLVRNESGAITDFQPLVQARAAVRKALSSEAIRDAGGKALNQAKGHLDAADVAWQSVGTPPKPESLATVRHQSYLAQRWAQIAQAQAGREEGLGRLNVARKQLDQRDASDERWLGSYLVPKEYGELAFATGTAQLTSASRGTVDKLAEFLQSHPRYGLRISGHTDSSPPSKRNLDRFLEAHPKIAEAGIPEADAAALYNLDMSRRRAAAVKSAIAEQGVDAQRLDVFAFGQTQPRASNDSAAGRRSNRRVEVLVVRAEEAREQSGAETSKGLGL